MRWLSIGALVALLGLVGCKSTELTVVNDLPDDATVTLQGPGSIDPSPPTLPVARAGRGVFKITTPNGELPANYKWQAGGRTGTLVIAKDSPREQVLNLSTGRAGRTTVQVGDREPVEVRVRP